MRFLPLEYSMYFRNAFENQVNIRNNAETPLRRSSLNAAQKAPVRPASSDRQILARFKFWT